MSNKLAWMKAKPTQPGYYLVRGYSFENKGNAAAVEVRLVRGTLMCNLHQTNTETSSKEIGFSGFKVSALSNGFEWCPLNPAVKQSGRKGPEKDHE